MKHPQREITNLERLESYWRRSPFHDEMIQEVLGLNKRILFRLGKMTLVITAASKLERCNTPAVWLSESIVPTGDGFTLDIETDQGRMTASGTDVRLIRNSDLAILIPPIDS